MGGADGVSAINTVQGLMEVKANSIPWPAVGKQKSTTYGGVSGNATRPVGLYAVSAIAKKFKDFPILGIGGIDSAETSLQFLQCGASAVQIGSAIQNQDFTLIEDYITGLKALLYIESLKELENWDGLSPPIIKHQKGKPVVSCTENTGKKLPHFGNYQELREEKIRDIKMQSNLLAESQSPSQVRPCYQPNKPVPKVKDVVGRSLSKIAPYSNLDNKEQVVALIDDDMCINCGKCYITCNDSGYQAITFDPKTHMPFVKDDCTGCTLCLSVCPIPQCINMVPRMVPHVVQRGIQERVQ
uniref:dihydropyrimidine dehydrogenase (NADP(+)) n=1 Tax=Timema shepardi TaxID=629360 RepID=A0A7R9B4G3_TIMSH|nr:unnamed protein product [Timema shepardi]